MTNGLRPFAALARRESAQALHVALVLWREVVAGDGPHAMQRMLIEDPRQVAEWDRRLPVHDLDDMDVKLSPAADHLDESRGATDSANYTSTQGKTEMAERDLSDETFDKILKRYGKDMNPSQLSEQHRTVVLVYHSYGILGNGGFQ